MNCHFHPHRIFFLVSLLFSVILLTACANLRSLLPTNPTAPMEPAVQEAGMTASANARTFQIVPEASTVTFTLGEELLGAPKTVTGSTTGIRGELYVDPATPANTTIGPIEIDANGFATDNERRNTAIRRFILETTDHPTITFVPTALSSLPATAAVGDSFDFQITGDLTIRTITRPVTFDSTVTVVSEDELTGRAEGTILRSDFELTIPNVPNVANVTEEVTLTLAFTARAE